LDLERIRSSLAETREVLSRVEDETAQAVAEAAGILVERVKAGGRVLICGNGGSAADAQHMATELVVRYLADRPGIPALALTVDTSILTAASNDYGFERVFARQIEALGRPGDVLIAISTSGTSPNVLRAVEEARTRGIATIGLAGRGGGKLAERCDRIVAVPSTHTPRIQEAHLVIEHLLCEAIEEAVGEEGTS
jgi:D-sedoheptulose 7-phosphate isomerase